MSIPSMTTSKHMENDALWQLQLLRKCDWWDMLMAMDPDENREFDEVLVGFVTHYGQFEKSDVEGYPTYSIYLLIPLNLMDT